MGRIVGTRALRRFVPAKPRFVDRGRAWFTGSGRWLLAFGSFVPGVRHIMPVAAGSASFDFRTFAAYAYPGAVLWSTTFVAAGYYGGDTWQRAAVAGHAHLIVASIVLAALAVAYVFARYRAIAVNAR